MKKPLSVRLITEKKIELFFAKVKKALSNRPAILQKKAKVFVLLLIANCVDSEMSIPRWPFLLFIFVCYRTKLNFLDI